MNRRALLIGFGVVGATALSGGGTVFALHALGLAPKPPEPGEESVAEHGPADRERPAAGHAPAPAASGASQPAAPSANDTSHAAAPSANAASHAAPAAPAGGPAHWSYEGPNGPAAWGAIEPANALCSLGGAQSPIDLTNPLRVTSLPGFLTSYGSTRVTVTNNGHTFQVNVDKGSSLKLDGKQFNLLQFHFHTPSEHTVDGKNAPLEMHLVHQAADKSLAVVGVLLTEGPANAMLARFWDKLPRFVTEVETGASIDLKELLPKGTTDYFTYAGSLTTPPCSESVRWIVLQQPGQVSKEQIAAFKDVFPANARPVMPLGARHLLHS